MTWGGKFLFGRKAKHPPKRRIAQPYGARGDWPTYDEILVKEFDELTEEEANDISTSVGASGARRPPSE